MKTNSLTTKILAIIMLVVVLFAFMPIATIISYATETVVDISDATVVLSGHTGLTYDGTEKKPTVTSVTDKNGQLVNPLDYVVTYENNINAGTDTAKVIITADDSDYTGSIVKTFSIEKASISSYVLTVGTENTEYTGGEIKPSVTVKVSSAADAATLKRDKDYKVTYGTNTDAGTDTATIDVEGIGNYKDSIAQATFSITEKPITKCTITPENIGDQTYTGAAIEPTITVKDGSRTLTKDIHYTVTYGENTAVANNGGSVTIAGTGNYSGSVTKNFNIVTKSISSGYTVDPINDLTYNKDSQKPAPVVKDAQGNVLASTNYDVVYPEDTTNVGTKTIIINGTGNYSGTIATATYKIVPIAIANEAGTTLETGFSVSGKAASKTYTGSALTQTLTISDARAKTAGADTYNFVVGKDYTISYNKNVNVGTAEFTITGTGNYTGSFKDTFTISAADLSANDGASPTPHDLYTIEDILDVTYNKEQQKPSVVVKEVATGKILTLTKDYTVAYGTNINAGTGSGSVTVTGTGNYTGSMTAKNFNILPKSVNNLTIEGVVDMPVDGSNQVTLANLVVKDGEDILTANNDYSVTYGTNVGIGEGTVTIAGLNNYGETLTRTFQIKASLATATVDAIPNQTYTGDEIKPTVVVKLSGETLKLNEDYTVAYTSNTDKGQATVTVTGINKYAGSPTGPINFNIVESTISDCTIAGVTDFVYDGTEKKPLVTVKVAGKTLVEGTDYAVTYSSDTTNVGEKSLTVTGINNWDGSKTVTYNVNVKSIAGCKIDDIATQVYNDGADITPGVVVLDGEEVLVEGIDFELSYSNNNEIGKATVVAKGKGNYDSNTTVSSTFQIAKSIAGCTVTGISSTGYEYTGAEIKPEIVVKDGEVELVEGKDYEVEYTANIAIGATGSAKIDIKGIGRYTLAIPQKTFSIVKADITKCTITEIPNQHYKNGNAVKPTVEVKNPAGIVLEEGTDYTVAYNENTEVGDAKVAVTGLNANYSNGTINAKFKIVDHLPEVVPAVAATCTKAGLTEGSKCSVCGEILVAQEATPLAEHTPVKVAAVAATCTTAGLTEGTKCDVCGRFIVAQTAVLPVGHTPAPLPAVAATCTTHGLTEGSKCSVCGEILVAQETTPLAEHTPVKVAAVAATCETAGKTEGAYCSVCNEVIVAQTEVPALGHKTETTLTKASTSKDGSIVTKCTVCNKEIKTEAIAKIATVSLSKTSYTYDGKAKKPSVTVKDSKGNKVDSKYYTVSYKNNKNIGKATVTVTFKGNYEGTKTVKFTVSPAKVSGLKATKTTKTTATLSWKKASGSVTGYKVYVWNNKTKSYDYYGKTKGTSITIKKLKGKTTYKFKVKAYKTVSGTQYAGPRTDAYKAKTK